MPILNNAYADLPDNPPGIITLGQDTFGRGVISVVDESKLPRNALKEARNLTMAEDGAPKVRPGVNWYGTAPTQPTSGTLLSTVTNLIANPNLETNATGWSGYLCTVARSTEQARGGTASMKATVGADTSGNPVAIFAATDLTIGQTYTFSAYIRTAVNRYAFVNCNQLTGSYGDVGSTVGGVWTRIKGTGVATATTANVEIGIAGETVGEVFYVDDAMLTLGSTLTDYFDGNTTSSVSNVYAWVGTVNGSASTFKTYTVIPASAIDGATMHVMVDDAVHLVVAAGGKIYRSLNDGVTWSVCATALGTQAVFTAGKKVRTEQANSFTYLYNGWDNIVRYDGTLLLATYTALPTPTTVSLTKVGLGGASQPYTYRYRVAAVNDIGYTIASTALTITSDRTRNTNDATNYTVFKWNAVTGAVRYDIYVGLIAGEESYIDSAENTLEYQDKGAAIEQVAVTAPDSNTTQGPRVGDMALIGSRLYATADRDNPYRIWISGAGRYIGAFGSAYESTYLDWQKGGQVKPVKIEDYRKGNNDPVATIWCRSKDGKGAVLQGTLEAFTVGDVTFPVPNFFKLPGSRGTDAPDSVVNVLNDYMYYNSQAIYNLGSRAQFLNLLSTDEASANIRPHVQRIRKSAAKDIAAHFQDARVYMSVPYESDENNYTIIYDTERKGWLPEGFTIGFQRFFEYTDTSSEEGQHLLCWKKGDTQLSEIADSIRGDYGEAFETTLITGLMHVNPKDRFEFMWAEEGEIELAQPQGSIQIELSGITREDGFKRLTEPLWIRPNTEKYSWSTRAWTTFKWTDTATTVVSYSEPSTKRYFNVQQDINAYQYRLNTFDLRADYIARTLQIKGTATIAGKPREWELFSE